jgi:hypothetical protein
MICGDASNLTTKTAAQAMMILFTTGVIIPPRRKPASR